MNCITGDIGFGLTELDDMLLCPEGDTEEDM